MENLGKLVLNSFLYTNGESMQTDVEFFPLVQRRIRFIKKYFFFRPMENQGKLHVEFFPLAHMPNGESRQIDVEFSLY